MVVRLGHFGKQIRNTWEVLKCGAGKDREDYLDGSCKQ
jgi:hypothetical protein